MTDPVLLIEALEVLSTVTLNRPESMNALSQELDRAGPGIRRLRHDTDTGVVILTGAAERSVPVSTSKNWAAQG